MKSIIKITNLGLPAVLGLGLAWVGHRIISNERKIQARETELQIELNSKSIKI